MDADLATTAGAWVVQELTRVPELAVVPPELIGATDGNGGVHTIPETLARYQADLAVTGRIWTAGGSPLIALQVVDESRAIGVVGPEALEHVDPMTGIAAVSERVTGLLAERLGGLQARPPRHPPRYQAYREYVLAGRARVGKTVRDSRPEVLRHYRRAAALDTTFIMPLLMEVGSEMGAADWAAADSTLALLASRRAYMTEADALFFKFRQARRRGDHAAAYVSIREAWRLDPIRFMPSYSWQAFQRGLYHEAQAAFDQEKRDFWATNDWKVAQANLHFLGRHAEEVEHVREARDGIRTIPSSSTQKRRVWRPWGEWRMHGQRWEASHRLSVDRVQYFYESGTIAHELWLHGWTDASAELWHEVLDGLQDLALGGDPAALRTLAIKAGDAGEFDVAAEAWARLLDTRTGLSLVDFGNLAVALAWTGDFSGAELAIDSAQARVNPIAPTDQGQSHVTIKTAMVHAAAGDRDASLRHLHRAFALGHAHFLMHRYTRDLGDFATDPEFQFFFQPRDTPADVPEALQPRPRSSPAPTAS